MDLSSAHVQICLDVDGDRPHREAVLFNVMHSRHRPGVASMMPRTQAALQDAATGR